MSKFASIADRDAIENEVAWDARDVPATVYGSLTRTKNAHGDGKAISFQLTSGPKDKAETLTWRQVIRREANQIKKCVCEGTAYEPFRADKAVSQ